MVASLCSVVAASVLCVVAAQWDNCGTTVTPLIFRGRPILQGEYPWLAGLYLQNASGQWDQSCGGTLISPRLVLTAAHCLVVIEGEPITANSIKVGLGKLYRAFNRNEDFSIIVDVSEVSIPSNFLGTVSNFALDVGLLKLAKPVTLTNYIVPACVDWDGVNVIKAGSKVQVAGWGTSENGSATDVAYAADMSYLDYQGCIVRVRPSYRNYVTHDKICSLSINGSQVDRGDSGGGLTWVNNGRHFVIGIVSTKVVDQNVFSIFTKVSNSEVHYWLQIETARLDPVPKYKKKYVLRNIKVTFHRALQMCLAEGKRLATIRNQEDNNNLRSTIKSVGGNSHENIWIAATDLGEEGEFVWMSTGEPVSFTNFANLEQFGQQPDNFANNEHCVHIWNKKTEDLESLAWNDVDCLSKFSFVCEYTTGN